MKIVFLDFDGVVRINGVFSQAAISNLQDLLDHNKGIKIVVSSSWRHKGLKFCRDELVKQGLEPNKIIDITDMEPNNVDRGHHVTRWLSKHPDVDKFVILDDEDDFSGVYKELVQTNPYVGLTSSDNKKAIDILNKTV